MPKAQRISGKKRAKHLTSAARQKRMFNLLRKKQPLIPGVVLKALAASRLPPQADAYNARLKELLGT